MDLYSATVNLNSKNQNQVHLTDLTATEIAVLSVIHANVKDENSGGFAPVVNVKKIGEVNRTDAEERERLIGVTEDRGVSKYRQDQYAKAFPSTHVPLPQVVSGAEVEPESKLDKYPGLKKAAEARAAKRAEAEAADEVMAD